MLQFRVNTGLFNNTAWPMMLHLLVVLYIVLIV